MPGGQSPVQISPQSEGTAVPYDLPCNGSWHNVPALHWICTHHQDVVCDPAGSHVLVSRSNGGVLFYFILQKQKQTSNHIIEGVLCSFLFLFTRDLVLYVCG